MTSAAIQDDSAAMVPPQGKHADANRWLRWTLWAVGVAGFVIALGPLVADYAQQTWRSEHYQFVVLLIPVALLLAVMRSRQASLAPGATGLRAVLWTVGIVSAAAAVLAASPFVAAVAVMLNLLAAIYEAGGRNLLRSLLPIWALTWLAVRLPFDGDKWLVTGLQSIATRWASGVLDLGGVRHVANGHAIRLPEQDFFIDQACSGVHSLFAALAFAGFFSVASRRGLVRTLLLLAATVFWVLVANVLRIGAVVVLSTRYDLPVTEGMGHELLGVTTFIVAVALIMSTDRLLLFFVPERDHGPLVVSPETRSRKQWFNRPEKSVLPSLAARRRRGWIGLGLVATAFVALAWGGRQLPSAEPASYQSQVLSIDGFKPAVIDDLPAEWNEWERVGFQVQHREVGDLAGELSRIWTYRKGRLLVAVSIDGPYDGWHDLTWCYTGRGYQIDAEQDATDSQNLTHTELQMTDELGRNGLVLYSAFTESDRHVSPPRAARYDALTRRILAAVQQRVGAPPAKRDERVYQVQVFTESGLGFSSTERDEIESLFRAMRNRVAGQPVSHRDGGDA